MIPPSIIEESEGTCPFSSETDLIPDTFVYGGAGQWGDFVEVNMAGDASSLSVSDWMLPLDESISHSMMQEQVIFTRISDTVITDRETATVIVDNTDWLDW